MHPTTFDTIVIGLGATGGATLYHLARDAQRQGASAPRVLGLDRFAPPHDRGSSHGHTRIYRQAYYEAPEYVPLALRALELWHELERDTGRTLFANTGVLTVGQETSELVAGATRSAREHGIAHELLSGEETARRFPAFRAPEHAIALFEPTGGVLFADLCIESHLALARAFGATVHTDELVHAIAPHVDGRVLVHTTRGTYEAGRVVVAAGAWTPRLLGLEHAFRVTRETVHWFEPLSPHASAKSCPVSMIAMDDGRMLYTIPDFGDGFKAGLHHTGQPADPDAPRAAIDAGEGALVAAALARHAPAGAGALRASVPCWYTSTPDQHFAVGPLAWAPGVLLAAACSGHGFKFATALGEQIAHMVRGEPTVLPMHVFDVARLGAPVAAI